MKLAKIITLIVAAGLTLSAAGNKKDLKVGAHSSARH